jgi:hypothetical protein
MCAWMVLYISSSQSSLFYLGLTKIRSFCVRVYFFQMGCGKLIGMLTWIGVSWFRLQIVEEKLVLQVQQLGQTALHWESKAQRALKHGESFDNCVKLIRLSKYSFCPVVKTCC